MFARDLPDISNFVQRKLQSIAVNETAAERRMQLTQRAGLFLASSHTKSAVFDDDFKQHVLQLGTQSSAVSLETFWI